MTSLCKSKKHFVCPLCANVLNCPKVLSCMHIFCEKCLNDYICSVKSYNCESGQCLKCPSCEIQVFTVNRCTRNERWVNTFSTCHVLQYFLDTNFTLVQNLFSTPTNGRNCTFCSEDNNFLQAFGFCSVCTANLCRNCYDNHKKFKVTRDHKVLIYRDFENDPDYSNVMSLSKYCKAHEKRELEFKCFDHDALVCCECCVLSHRYCQLVKHIDDLSADLQMSSQVLCADTKQLQDRIEVALISEIQLAKECDYMTDQVGKVADDLAEGFETAIRFLEKDILQEFREERETVISFCSQCIDECTQFSEGLNLVHNLSNIVYEHCSDVHFMLLINKFENTEHEIKGFLSKHRKNDSFGIFTSVSDKIEKLNDILEESVYSKIQKLQKTLVSKPGSESNKAVLANSDSVYGTEIVEKRESSHNLKEDETLLNSNVNFQNHIQTQMSTQ